MRSLAFKTVENPANVPFPRKSIRLALNAAILHAKVLHVAEKLEILGEACALSDGEARELGGVFRA
ncbi:hypothetical protein [Fibrobacter intestinalis]|uniref:hypothetical protein n=1 Tax=Fibrobacter TaxID=832 RepID=UPI000BB0E203|nr:MULTISPECIES: hypothetical protein [Fibrobacter]PBC73552.1 hypothetical protein BGW94_1164 [Fibrobacter sp. NR9]